GSVNKKVQTIVAKAGFKFGCGVYTGPPRFGGNDYDIRRLAITYNTNKMGFLLRLLTPFQYMEWLYGKVRNNGKMEEDHCPEKKAPIPEYDFTTTNNL
ncbi:MAG: hypothetical protein WD597_01355, partial [Balneolaceae bacterium]